MDERAAAADWPAAGEAQTHRLDISAVVDRKRQAIAAHRTQHGEVIDDDPGGFVIGPSMRRRAECATEFHFEANRP